jgi:hypothetical protein
MWVQDTYKLVADVHSQIRQSFEVFYSNLLDGGPAVAQADLELLGSNNPPASASHVSRTTGIALPYLAASSSPPLFFLRQSCYAAQAGFELLILLP